MAQDIVFYTNPMSRGRIVRWMLEEIGCAYQTRILEYGAEMKAPDFLAVNPMGKVPALTHGSAVITETSAIVAYLADAFPEAALAPPPGDAGRGSYLRWMFFAAGPLEAAQMDKSLGVVVPPEKERMVGYGSLGQVLDTFEGALATSDYLLGSTFSAADIYAGSLLGFGMMFGMLEKRPVFERYCQRIQSRPAAVRAARIDDELIAKAAAKG